MQCNSGQNIIPRTRPVNLMNSKQRNLPDQATQLRHASTCISGYRLHLPAPFVLIPKADNHFTSDGQVDLVAFWPSCTSRWVDFSSLSEGPQTNGTVH